MEFLLGHSVTYQHTIPNMLDKSPVDFFNLLFNDDIKKNIWEETTRFANQYTHKHSEFMASHSKARAHDWVKQPMSLKEVDALLSIIIAMGIVGYPTIRYEKYTLHIHLYI